MFLAFGHSNVRILNGGLKKWRAEGRATETGETKPKPATFKASYDSKRVRSMQQLIANVESRAEQVIDARAADPVEGRAPEPRPGRRELPLTCARGGGERGLLLRERIKTLLHRLRRGTPHHAVPLLRLRPLLGRLVVRCADVRLGLRRRILPGGGRGVTQRGDL